MANNGTIVGSPAYVAAASGFGQAIQFDGATECVSIGNALQVAAGGSFTVRCRIRTTATGANQVIVGSDYTGWLGLNNGVPKANVNESSDGSTTLTLNGSASIADGAWHELELTVASGAQPPAAYLFSDGAMVASGQCSYSPITINSGNPTAIGAYPGTGSFSNFFPGTVDEVSIWSAPQHTAAYSVGPTPVSNVAAGLANLYHFDGNATDSAGVSQGITLTPAASNFWDNGYNGSVGGAVQTSEFARLVVVTDATGVTVGGYSDMYADWSPSIANVGVRVNGSAQTQLTFQASTGSFNVALPGTAGTSVEFVNGPQQVQTNNASAWYGSYVSGLTFTGGTTAAFVSPSPANTLLVYGDSIEGGGPNANLPFGAWTELLRATWPGDVQVEAYGGRTLYDDCSTASGTAAFAQRLSGYAASKVVICIGVNDYSNGQWSLAAFAAAYGSLLDQFHALKPAVPVAVVAPLLTTSREGANGAGVTLDQYRSAVVGLTSGRPWLAAVNAKPVLPAADINAGDGVHPTIVGQVALSQFYLGVALALSAGSSGLSQSDVASIVNGILNATPPALSGKATTIGSQINQLWRRFFGPSALSAKTLTTYADDGSTVLTQQALADNGTVQSVAGA